MAERLERDKRLGLKRRGGPFDASGNPRDHCSRPTVLNAFVPPLPLIDRYSDRSATAGSTLVAIRVGRYDATKATTVNKSVTVR